MVIDLVQPLLKSSTMIGGESSSQSSISFSPLKQFKQNLIWTQEMMRLSIECQLQRLKSGTI